jgi:hypothetical protein
MKRLLLTLAIIGVIAITQARLSAAPGEMPAFHEGPPAKGEVLPAIWSQKQLTDAGYTAAAQKEGYKAAAKAGEVMYQMPCYCFCDRNHGHSSLRSCFESNHGANCGTCLAEALYSYKMSKKGWTAKMVRDGIVRREYEQMDLQHPEPVL